MKAYTQYSMKALLQSIPHSGKIEWIGCRPQKRGAVEAVESARLTPEAGLDGDHYSGRSGKRQVTLIQAEHLPVVAAILRKETVAPALTRRNIVVSGINLLALKGQQFRLGEALLEYTGECHPCSRMEENFGAGGYNAMRGHGGITARVLEAGTISVGASVSLHITEKEDE